MTKGEKVKYWLHGILREGIFAEEIKFLNVTYYRIVDLPRYLDDRNVGWWVAKEQIHNVRHG